MHAFNYRIFCLENQDYDALIPELNLVNREDVNPIPEIIFNTDPSFAANWSQTNIDQKLAILEMIYYASISQYQSQILAAVVGTIFGICKAQNFTDGWLMGRLARVTQQYPDLDITDKVTRETLLSFASRYVKQGTDIVVISNFLKSIYPSLTDTALNSLNWVIEQAQGQSCTHGLAYARSIQEYQSRPLVLMGEVPREQYVQFAILVANLAVDPWGSLYKPAVTASQYPDLANIGNELMKETDRKYRGYQGTWIEGGVYSRVQIRAIAEAIRGQQQAYIEELANPVTVIRSNIPDVEVLEINDMFYLYTNDNKPLSSAMIEDMVRERQRVQRDLQRGEPDEWEGYGRQREPVPVRDALPDLQPIPEEQLAEARRGWPGAARRLPQNAMRVDPVALNNIMKVAIAARPDFKAIQELSSIAISATRQGPIKPYGDIQDNIAILNRYNSSFDASLTNPLAVFELTLQQLFPNKGPDANPVAYNPNTMVTEEQFMRPRRRAIGLVAANPPPPNNRPQGQGALNLNPAVEAFVPQGMEGEDQPDLDFE